MLKLEKLLASLPQTVFTASDALGWVYQFWQSKKKEDINRSQVKIGADEIAAVTQLFTEPYMVEFLLHNTLGAWWAGKKLAANDDVSAASEDELRRKLALPGVDWRYLRFVRGADGKGGPWRPAAGTFDGWPKTAAELKVLDPCCGSGHFLVAALHHLVPIRMAEEGLSAAQAIDVVLRDNLHGLEIDERCCQIAAFALAFAVWTYPGAAGYRSLPELHIACTGIAPNASKDQWLRLGEEIAAKGGMPAKRDLFGAEDSLLSSPVKQTLEALHELFSQAPVLGSLIDPARLRTDLFHADYKTVAPLLSKVLETGSTEDETRERVIAAAGMIKAAEFLAGKYTLVTTNVPYLGYRKQAPNLKRFCEEQFPDSYLDLAAVFFERSLHFSSNSSSVALVLPESVAYLGSFDCLRRRLLVEKQWNIVGQLGEGGFTSSQAAGAQVALFVVSTLKPEINHQTVFISARTGQSPDAKGGILADGTLRFVPQSTQTENPNYAITGESAGSGSLLSKWASAYAGILNGDSSRFVSQFWEVGRLGRTWEPLLGSPAQSGNFNGREKIIRWEGGNGQLETFAQEARDQLHDAHRRGNAAWGKWGVAVVRMRDLKATLYCGELFDQSISVICPTDQSHVLPIWCLAESGELTRLVRKINPGIAISSATTAQIPFDLTHWQEVAAQKYSQGLPKPLSSDPTQWLFDGQPKDSQQPLHVSLARLLGYPWPRQTGSSFPDCPALGPDGLEKLADEDGIVCIPSVRGEEPAAERLEALLSAAGIKPAKARELAGGADLDDWLRNTFFEEHCKLFHDRPFVWHFWDGRKRDGFHALVNYHKLCEGKHKGRKLLESLTYSYMGNWIARQKDGVKRGEGGADDRLTAALELQNRLKLILEGEPPFDLFIRWKPLAEQPIGWEPDINDGVRMNIRPFLASDLPAGRTGAGVLRWKPNVKWDKDRGKEPKRPKEEYPWLWNWNGTTIDFMGTGKEPDGNRWNDCHYTIAAKNLARDKSNHQVGC